MFANEIMHKVRERVRILPLPVHGLMLSTQEHLRFEHWCAVVIVVTAFVGSQFVLPSANSSPSVSHFGPLRFFLSSRHYLDIAADAHSLSCGTLQCSLFLLYFLVRGARVVCRFGHSQKKETHLTNDNIPRLPHDASAGQ